MTSFLNLPREIRDLIYDEVILWQHPRLIPDEKFMVYDRNSRFKKVYGPQSALTGEYGCAYSLAAAPSTCANMLACNRQVNAEMREAIERVEKEGLLHVTMDCVAEDESYHYFAVLGAPLVRTETSAHAHAADSTLVTRWMKRWLTHYVVLPLQLLYPTFVVSECASCRSSKTSIRTLWLDVRITGDRKNKWHRNIDSSLTSRTGWAVCAALKRFFERGPYLAAERDQACTLSVDELVLNVVPPPSSATAKTLDEDFPLDAVGEGIVHPRTVAKELVDVWNKLWAADDVRGVFYGRLLEQIGRVRVCVDGETFGERGLRTTLERGHRERRIIAARGGWFGAT